MKLKKRTVRQASSWLNASIVGIQFPVAIAIGYFWGKWLDETLGTGRWLTLVFTLLGIIAGFVNLFRITAKAARDEEEEARWQAEEEAGDDGPGSRGDGTSG